MKGKAVCAMLALALVAVAGCSGLQDVSLTPCAEEPGWIARGSGVFGPLKERQIFGVGMAFPAREKGQKQKEDGKKKAEKAPDAKAMAEKQARKELAAQAEGWTTVVNRAMAREMAGTFKDGRKGALSFLQDAGAGLPSAAAEKAEVRARWTCGVTGEAFCRVALTEDRLASMYMERAARAAQKKNAAKALKVKPDEFVSALKKDRLMSIAPSGNLSD